MKKLFRFQEGEIPDEMQLRGTLRYDVTRAGVFRVEMNLPEPWEIVSVEPGNLVEDYDIVGKGADRRIKILLRKETLGKFGLVLTARTSRGKSDDDVEFVLPLCDTKNLKQYSKAAEHYKISFEFNPTCHICKQRLNKIQKST